MKYIFTSLFLSILFFSCEISTPKNETLVDPFREDVLRLRHAGLLKSIPDTKVDSLISIYRKDSLNGIKNLLALSGDLLKIHTAMNGKTLQEVYQKICDTIGMKYPELKCDEVQTSILPTDEKHHDTSWVVLRLRFNQTWYERKLYYFKDWQIDDFVYRVYNRFLADNGKLQRLHLVEFNCKGCGNDSDDYMGNTDVSQYGYLMLSKGQEDSIMSMESLQMEPEHEFDVFTTAKMDEQLKKLESSGLVDKMGKAWYENAKKDVYYNSIYKMEDLYDIFDTLFCRVSFDTLVEFNPYSEMLTNMAKISRGKFKPTSITDELENATSHHVEFTFETDVYKFDAETNGGLYFPGIIDNVNKALEDHKTGGAFYTILTDENVCLLIYIENDMVEKVKASGFFLNLEKGPSREIKDRWSIPKL